LELGISIPLEAERLEHPLELVGKTSNRAFAIEVVDPEQPTSALVARAQVAASGCQQRSEVQWP
jgi:hypothetical protein